MIKLKWIARDEIDGSWTLQVKGFRALPELNAHAVQYQAATEMLEALYDIVKLARLDCLNLNCTCIQCCVVKKAKSAIAKAEGRT